MKNLLGISAGFIMGSVAMFTAKPEAKQETAAVFGYGGLTQEAAIAYPHCQTDFKMSTNWTPELMWLNGIWTAACVYQSDEIEKELASRASDLNK